MRLLARPDLGKGATVRFGLERGSAHYARFGKIDLSTSLSDIGTLVEVAAEMRALVARSRARSGSVLVQRQSRRFATRECWHRLLRLGREREKAWGAEIVASAQRLGSSLRESPVSSRHPDRSRIGTLRGGAAVLLAVLHIAHRLQAVPRPGEASRPGEVFGVEQARSLLKTGADHWWLRSKAAFVSEIFAEHGVGDSGTLVDLGSGTGSVTAVLAGRLQATAVEGSESLAQHAHGHYGLRVVVGTMQQVPIRESCAHAVTLLDVIEHLDDPRHLLREARRILRPGGHLVVTVPGHRWLWSEADEYFGHRRRYTRRMLDEQLRECGFDVLRLTHVFSWCVPPVWIIRRFSGSLEAKLGVAPKSPATNRALHVLTSLEQLVVRRVSLPLGTSIIGVGRRPPSHTTIA